MIKKIGPRAMGMASLLVLGALLMLVGIMGSDLGATKPAETNNVPPAKKYTYLCEDGKHFTLEIDTKEDCVLLTLDGKFIRVPRVVAASGARYSNGKTTVWLKDNEAFIEMDGKIIFKNCRTQESYHP